MRYLRARLDLPAELHHPMQEFLRESDRMEREELLTWNVLPGRDVEYALFYAVGDRAAYREAIDDVDSIPEYTLTPIDDESFYSYVCQETREEERVWRTVFADLNLVVMPPIVYDSRARTHITVVGTDDSLSTLVEQLEAGPGVDVEVLELGDFDRRHGAIAGQLTGRQLELVETAAELGYYEVPREASLEAVADAAGVARSTASTVLRRAESAVMGALVGA
ncbi:Transcriptional regulator, contains HTH domain [Halorhabdus sp. SVX81]|uniref:helix-turn-helix domain-containing protein n=1 Tax=Halorhabdus sp. SVX81 TaxID=2978283 RepID=UPI0023DBDE42|nr:helix-turn-helix domain-containing protein [Halorhabdus sp. SVX81]WEL17029.1 Transcriptional regulator, contains HTH domain [Halorhabdus sp. SVX81]